MADGTSNIDEHQNVADDNDEGVLATLLSDVVRDASLSHVVSFQSHQIDSVCTVFRDYVRKTIHECMVVILAICEFSVVVLVHYFVETLYGPDENILLPLHSSGGRVLIVVKEEGHLETSSIHNAL